LFILTDFDLHERPELVGLDILAAYGRLSEAA